MSLTFHRQSSSLADGAAWATHLALISPRVDGCGSPVSQLMKASSGSPVGGGVIFLPAPPGTLCPVQNLPLPVGRPDAALLPRVVDPRRSRALEIGPLRIELKAEPHGPGLSGRKCTSGGGHVQDGDEAAHSPSAAASAEAGLCVKAHQAASYQVQCWERWGYAWSARVASLMPRIGWVIVFVNLNLGSPSRDDVSSHQSAHERRRSQTTYRREVAGVLGKSVFMPSGKSMYLLDSATCCMCPVICHRQSQVLLGLHVAFEMRSERSTTSLTPDKLWTPSPGRGQWIDDTRWHEDPLGHPAQPRFPWT